MNADLHPSSLDRRPGVQPIALALFPAAVRFLAAAPAPRLSRFDRQSASVNPITRKLKREH